MLINSTTKEYEKPTDGLYDAVLADIVDLGLVQTQYGSKPKVRIVWLLSALDSEKNNFRVMQQVTASMDERSRLFATVKDIIGKEPTVPFETEDLIGHNNQLLIQQATVNGKTFANVKAILQAKPGVKIAVPSGFVRDKDKKNQNQQSQGQAQSQRTAVAAAPVEVADEDIPF